MSFEEVMHGKRWENAIDKNKKEEWQIRAKISFKRVKGNWNMISIQDNKKY